MRQSIGSALAQAKSKKAIHSAVAPSVLEKRLRHIDDLVRLRNPFKAGLEIKARTTKRSVLSTLQGLNLGLGNYLRSIGEPGLGLDEISEEHIRDLCVYIDKSDNMVSGGPLSANSKALRLAKFYDICNILRADTRWGRDAGRIARYIKSLDPWPYAQRESRPTQRLGLNELSRLQRLCEDECLRLQEEARKAEERFAKGRHLVEKEGRSAALRHFDAFFYLCVKAYPRGVIPSLTAVSASDPFLSNVMRHWTRSRVDELLYASGAVILPFLILLTITFNANIEIFGDLRLDEIESGSILGRDFTSLRGKKGRARRGVLYTAQNSVALRTNVNSMMETLRAYTRRLRDVCPQGNRDLVFLFFDFRTQSICTLQQTESAGSSYKIRQWLHAFCEDNNLPKFGWRSLRKTIVDENFQQNGDLAAVAEVAQHRSPDTTYESYLSEGSKSQLREGLGIALLAKDRMLRAPIDARLRTNRQPKLAATHGFGCLDPHDSPFAQSAGALCEAYGRCPICPHHTFDNSIVENVAAYQALTERVLEAGIARPASWRPIWKPVYERLNAILASTPGDVRQQASGVEFFMLPVE